MDEFPKAAMRLPSPIKGLLGDRSEVPKEEFQEGLNVGLMHRFSKASPKAEVVWRVYG